jgi:hypothetical protein
LDTVGRPGVKRSPETEREHWRRISRVLGFIADEETLVSWSSKGLISNGIEHRRAMSIFL